MCGDNAAFLQSLVAVCAVTLVVIVAWSVRTGDVSAAVTEAPPLFFFPQFKKK